MKYTLSSFLVLVFIGLQAQYAPAPPSELTTAIHKDSSVIVNWAKSCVVQRGFIDANRPSKTYTFQDSTSNRAFFGVDSNAVGKSFGPGDVVSLGDLGKAILSFNPPIVNGPGYDFVVFENGFKLSGENNFYLELARVGVIVNPNDSAVYFSTYSETPFDQQLSDAEGINPEFIHGLAGKYPYPYGTPFDLSDLAISIPEGASISGIVIQDVGGMISSDLVTKDLLGRPINDPYPTAYHTGGFDLMAVGVINQALPDAVDVNIYPNPVDANGTVFFGEQVETVCLYSLSGELIAKGQNVDRLKLTGLQQGLYLLNLEDGAMSKALKLSVNALDH
ncbi:T9SS type A sorting domain-containing protein [Luteibaculum oceani]|nr:T9SS type A sorting domain-containing protein [Luteibaculum oceani]